MCRCVCLCLSVCPRLHAHTSTDPDVTWRSGSGCPLVVHYWADLQSLHGLRCYGNITRTRNVSECSVLALCLVTFCVSRRRRKTYCGHARLCVCVTVRGRMPTLLHWPGCNFDEMPPSCDYWEDSQSVHGLRCYGNITRNISECYMHVLAQCLVDISKYNRPVQGRDLHTGATVHLWRATVHP